MTDQNIMELKIDAEFLDRERVITYGMLEALTKRVAANESKLAQHEAWIIENRDRLAALTLRVDEVERDLTNLTQEVARVDGDLTQLTTKVGQIDENVDALKDVVAEHKIEIDKVRNDLVNHTVKFDELRTIVSAHTANLVVLGGKVEKTEEAIAAQRESFRTKTLEAEVFHVAGAVTAKSLQLGAGGINSAVDELKIHTIRINKRGEITAKDIVLE